MTIHIENMTNEVITLEGELPLSQKQIEMLVTAVLTQLEKVQREKEHGRAATAIRPQAAPPA